jgi:adenosylhomocysteinase
MTNESQRQTRSPQIGFPTLTKLASTLPTDRPRVHQRLVLVTHVLPTALPFVRCLATAFALDVVAIPYSSHHATLEALREADISVECPTTVDDVGLVARERITAALQRGEQVLVQEIGGYLAPYAREFARYPTFLGIVEDTSQGDTRYQPIRDLRYPVVSIARSPIKALEDRMIGHAVAFSLERILRETFYETLVGQQILVLGYGSIGSSCAQALRQRGGFVTVYDIDPVRMAHAAIDGHSTRAVEPALSAATVVIGASGQRSINDDMLSRLNCGALVLSASSKQIEIDVDALTRTFSLTETTGDVQLYESSGQHFYLICRGHPINFRDQSVLGPSLDATYAELCVCIREVAQGRAGYGFKASWSALHREVADAWCAVYLGTPHEGAPHEGAIPYASRELLEVGPALRSHDAPALTAAPVQRTSAGRSLASTPHPPPIDKALRSIDE